ncbi:hypothetical protein [Rubrivirga sp. SAORIC476]|uniref:hypothetical protein n=1 Tax=Rubrivirga sp. SAORIC476 TaxID=1961794 RepID=UPI0018E94DBC|nr:hypothetical protein [Rubrivirga sp. SAORIC476]|tara:strand:- start:213 stop:389 length:177 start_codon:yes stop_codon:yes gene_type:complete
MAKKVSKNQRTNRGAGQEAKQMAKIIVASKKQNGQFEFRSKMVEASTVQDELKAAQAA